MYLNNLVEKDIHQPGQGFSPCFKLILKLQGHGVVGYEQANRIIETI